MEVGSHRGMMANEDTMADTNSYETVKTILNESKFYSRGNKM